MVKQDRIDAGFARSRNSRVFISARARWLMRFLIVFRQFGEGLVVAVGNEQVDRSRSRRRRVADENDRSFANAFGDIQHIAPLASAIATTATKRARRFMSRILASSERSSARRSASEAFSPA